MAQSVSLYYFSGTGNTERIALTVYGKLRDRVSSCSVRRMEDHLKGESSHVIREPVVGILFPVYFHVLPRVVKTFLWHVEFSPFSQVFIIGVSSRDSYWNRTALLAADRILSRKEAIVFYHDLVVMPRNYRYKYPDNLSHWLVSTAEKRMDTVVNKVVSCAESRLSFSVFHYLIMLCSPIFRRCAVRFGKKLVIESSCSRCGRCIRSCPTGNLVMDRGIKQGNRCTLCLRCIYNCPEGAIRPLFMSKLPIPGRYNLEASITSAFALNPLPENYRKVDAGVRSYYKRHQKK